MSEEKGHGGGGGHVNKVNLKIAAAASLENALLVVEHMFNKRNPGVKETNIYPDSSGNLARRIANGSLTPDIFFSASTAAMTVVEDAEKVLTPGGGPFDILGNKLVLIANKAAMKIPGVCAIRFCNIKDIADVAPDAKFFMADPGGDFQVPAGIYTRQTFRVFGNWRWVKCYPNTVMNGAEPDNMFNVRRVLAAVADSADPALGAVYRTDALIRSCDVTILDTAPSCVNDGIIYPAAVLEASEENAEMALKFVNFLQSDIAGRIFESFGFRVLNSAS